MYLRYTAFYNSKMQKIQKHGCVPLLHKIFHLYHSRLKYYQDEDARYPIPNGFKKQVASMARQSTFSPRFRTVAEWQSWRGTSLDLQLLSLTLLIK